MDTEEESQVLPINTTPSWMTPIVHYLLFDEWPEEKLEAWRIKFKTARYVIHDGLLYHRENSTLLFRCLTKAEVVEVLKEIHEGICGNHTGGNLWCSRSLDKVTTGQS